MEATDLFGLLAIGFAAGMLGGLVGVGGGVLFVPAFVLFLGVSQLEAEGTSLLAMVLVAIVGAARQSGYGNLRLRDGLIVGVLSPIGVGAGTVLANNLPERTLELSFAALQLYFAYGLARRALRSPDPSEAPNG
ncbi:MAG: sulfite exporter TauE/SafE family protein [Thermoleophilaceae bacterium]|jgi:uncharacterized membrane protein YfcA|nr:sulfite exporter TauE/SafE family protein [Thermoleophilaceae bacterium]